jgi:hypothetical protein
LCTIENVRHPPSEPVVEIVADLTHVLGAHGHHGRFQPPGSGSQLRVLRNGFPHGGLAFRVQLAEDQSQHIVIGQMVIVHGYASPSG